jgi:hypothetical protein
MGLPQNTLKRETLSLGHIGAATAGRRRPPIKTGRFRRHQHGDLPPSNAVKQVSAARPLQPIEKVCPAATAAADCHSSPRGGFEVKFRMREVKPSLNARATSTRIFFCATR